MKIIIFNDAKEVLDVIEQVRQPKAYSRSEIRWENGGISGMTENNFVIVNDDQQLEDLTDAEIFEQQKYQEKLSLARLYDENRIEALAKGTEVEEEERFVNARAAVDNAAGKEGLTIAANNYKNRRKDPAPAAKQPAAQPTDPAAT